MLSYPILSYHIPIPILSSFLSRTKPTNQPNHPSNSFHFIPYKGFRIQSLSGKKKGTHTSSIETLNEEEESRTWMKP
jgi:hypothetical protein